MRPKRHDIQVGTLGNPHFITIPLSASVGEAIKKVRQSAQRGDIFYVYVVENDQRLVGITSIRNLLVAKDPEPVKEIASTNVVSLRENTSLRDAYKIFAKSRFLSLPIVNDSGILTGVIHAHELIEEYGKEQTHLLEERSQGELFELLGIKAEDAEKGPVRIARGRLPWLLVNIMGGAISAIFIHRLSGRLTRAVDFLSFIPVLLILSESVGMQTTSLIIAYLHRASSRIRFPKFIMKELLVSLILGLACALIIAIPVYAWKQSASLALSIVITLAIGPMGVCLLGNFIPRLFHRLAIDPRVAAGPVVLAVADSAVLLLYLLIAIWLSN